MKEPHNWQLSLVSNEMIDEGLPEQGHAECFLEGDNILFGALTNLFLLFE